MPLRVIMENAGYDSDIILYKVLDKENFNHGFDLNTNKYCDMLEAGILDSAKVERVALENSSSVASMMLMTNTIIYTPNK